MAISILQTVQPLLHRSSSFVKLQTGVDVSLLNVAVAGAALWFLLMLPKGILQKRSRCPPAVPGIPIIGNLLQLDSKKPYETFTAWSEKYGPIYKIKLGTGSMFIISSAELAKEAMITKFPSIATRKLSKALSVLTRNKRMVAMSDYGDEHRMLKKLVVNNLLGANPQKVNRSLREKAENKNIDDMYNELKSSAGILNVKDYLQKLLFPFSMIQVLGRDPDSVDVAEIGRRVSRWEMFEMFVIDPLKAVLEIDWRDFFPALKWVPNRALEEKVEAVSRIRGQVIRALIAEEKDLLAKGKEPNCYLDTLLTQATHLTPEELEMSTWEPIIESADTTLVTIEWAMYEIAKNPRVQAKLYEEIKEVCGSRIVTEDDLPKLKYLEATVKETLRRYPPLVLLPPRHVDEDVQLGGYDVKKGDQIIINVYGINHNKNVWKQPEVWEPERLLGDDSVDLGFQDQRVLPFGTGKRMCAGVIQAMYIVPMTVALYVQHFHFALGPSETPTNLDDMVFLTTHKLHPLQCIVTPRCPSRLPPLLNLHD